MKTARLALLAFACLMVACNSASKFQGNAVIFSCFETALPIQGDAP